MPVVSERTRGPVVEYEVYGQKTGNEEGEGEILVEFPDGYTS